MSDKRRELAVRAWAALLRVHAAVVPEIDAEVQRVAGLPLSWYDVLLELANADDGRMTMSELGERVVLSRTRVSRIVDDLVAGALVTREGNPDDRRSSFAVLTDAGRTRYREAAPHYLQAIEEKFATSLTDSQLQSLAAALHRVLEPTDVPLTGRRA